MNPIEVIGHVDEQGELHVDLFDEVPPGPVKVLLQQFTQDDEEEDWRAIISHSLAAELNDPREDVYTLADGEPERTSDRPGTPALLSWEVLRIAHQDAEKAYRDLSDFRIRLAIQQDGWHIDYDVKAAGMQGGGPHYVIDAVSGAILHKRYEQ